MSCHRQPCPTCPWRVDQHADVIPSFSLELAEGLISTTDTDLGAPIFACHQSREGRDVICRGWLVRHGWDSIAIRLQMLNGRISPEELEVGEGWPQLHADYEEVLSKLRDDCAQRPPYQKEN